MEYDVSDEEYVEAATEYNKLHASLEEAQRAVATRYVHLTFRRGVRCGHDRAMNTVFGALS